VQPIDEVLNGQITAIARESLLPMAVGVLARLLPQCVDE
jgi:hypothetical protein